MPPNSFISNCYIHFSNKPEIYDRITNDTIHIDPLVYPDGILAGIAKDSIIRNSKVIRNTKFDVQELSSEYLIDHIDFMYTNWKNSPWYNDIDYQQFCKYILPYRAINEPLSDWSGKLYKKYHHILDTLTDKNILNACKAVNEVLAGDIKYDRRWIKGGLGIQSIPEMERNRSGMCDDMTVYGICVMRALGIPVAVDFDIHGRIDLGHSWCVVFDEKGKTWSFGAGEDQPGEHIKTFDMYEWKKLAKVFRRNFFINPEGLYAKVENLNEIPPFFRARNITDVTHEYIKTFDVEYTSQTLPKNQKYFYLCVYNERVWRPIQCSEVEKNNLSFSGMGPEIMYLIAYYFANQIHPVSDPFILNKDGTSEFISGDGEPIPEFKLYDKIRGLGFIEKDKPYQLYIWKKNTWSNIKEYAAQEDSILTLRDIKKNTLYRVEVDARPFVVNDSIVYW